MACSLNYCLLHMYWSYDKRLPNIDHYYIISSYKVVYRRYISLILQSVNYGVSLNAPLALSLIALGASDLFIHVEHSRIQGKVKWVIAI